MTIHRLTITSITLIAAAVGTLAAGLAAWAGLGPAVIGSAAFLATAALLGKASVHAPAPPAAAIRALLLLAALVFGALAGLFLMCAMGDFRWSSLIPRY